MNFRKFVLLTEADPPPMDGPPMGGPPMGGPPMGGPPMGGPPMGGPPMGGPPMGGPPMGGPPMGGPPMGGPPSDVTGSSESPVIPKYSNVWDVLDHILTHNTPPNNKEVNHKKKAEPQSGMMGNPALMS